MEMVLENNTISLVNLALNVNKSTPVNMGNNKITELRTILQKKVKTHKYINRQSQ
jgi:hypothetical protein